MKVLIVFLLLFSATTFAAGPVGDLSIWKGQYEVIKCSQCPDHVVEGGANLKNLILFEFNYGKIDPENQFICAETDVWMGMDFTIVSDDRTIIETLGHSTAQCDWSFNESLTATPDSFVFETKGLITGKAMYLEIKKIDGDKYKLRQITHDKTPSFGYPADYEYIVDIKKRNLDF